MRRGWIVIALVALGLAAAGAAVVAASRLAPRELRAGAERRLSAWAGAPVTVGAVHLSLGQGLAVELRDVGLTGGALRGRVAHGVARLDAVALVLGRVSPGAITLSGADLTWTRPTAAGASGAAPPAGDDAATPEAWAAALDSAAARLFGLASLPARTLELRDARLVLVADGDPTPVLALEGVEARLRRSRLRQRSELHVEAGLAAGASGSVAGRLAADLVIEPDALDARLRGGSLALALLADAARALGVGAPAGRNAGRAGGELRWRAGAGEPHRLEAALTARDRPALGLGGSAAPPEPVELAFQAELGHRALRLHEARLREGGAALRAAGVLGLPVRDAAPLRLEAELSGVALADLPALVARLPEAARQDVLAALAPVEAGSLVLGRVEGEGTLASWRLVASGHPLAELALRLEVADVRLRVGAGDPLEDLAGALTFDGDTLRVEGLRARRGGSALPRLDGSLRGLAHLRGPDELNCVAPAASAPLPGARDLLRWMSRPPDEDAPPRWTGVSVEADWIAHPALLCSLEQVSAALRPADGGLDFVLERGVWAGVPLSGRAEYRTGEAAAQGPPPGGAAPDAGQAETGARDRVTLELHMGPPFEAMTPRPPAQRWMQGRFDAGPTVLGTWHLARARGAFRTAASTLHLVDVEVALDPGGALQGRVAVDLSARGPLPIRLSAQVQGAEILQVAPAVGIHSDALSGSLHGAAALESRIERGRSFLAEARGVLSLHARDGRIQRRLGLLEALTLAEGGWNPFATHDELPYRAIDLVGRVGGGVLESEVLTLDGPTVRMVGTGRLDVAKPHALEVVLGVFPFRALDGVLGRLPVVNRVLLGADQSLMGAYYALEGPFAAPRARLIPIKTLAAGPASFVLEDVPGFVWGGLKRIQSVLSPDREPTVALPEPPAERADS